LVGEVIYEELCEMAETLVDWRKESELQRPGLFGSAI